MPDDYDPLVPGMDDPDPADRHDEGYEEQGFEDRPEWDEPEAVQVPPGGDPDDDVWASKSGFPEVDDLDPDGGPDDHLGHGVVEQEAPAPGGPETRPPPVPVDTSEALPGLDDVEVPEGVGSRSIPSAMDDAIGSPPDIDRRDSDLPGLGDDPAWPDEPPLDPAALADPDDSWSRVASENGLLTGAVLAAALGAGAVGFRMRSRNGRNEVNPAEAVEALDRAGLEARMEHGDLTDLERALGAGVPVAMSGAGGWSDVIHLSGVDWDAAALDVTEADGTPRRVGMGAFLQLWEDTAGQMVVTAGASPMVALPVAVGPEQAFRS